MTGNAFLNQIVSWAQTAYGDGKNDTTICCAGRARGRLIIRALGLHKPLRSRPARAWRWPDRCRSRGRDWGCGWRRAGCCHWRGDRRGCRRDYRCGNHSAATALLKPQARAAAAASFLERRHASQDSLEHWSMHLEALRRELPSDLAGNSLLTQNVGRHEQEPRCGVVMLGTILLIILILILIGSLPTWPYSGGWGYYPSGGFGLLVVIVIILLLMGRI